MDKQKRLHFLLIYPLNTAPSQRFRFEQYFPLLRQHGITYSTNSFYDAPTHALLYKSKGKPQFILRLALCFFRRCRHMLFLKKYDCLFIQRAASPLGPPVFEWIIRYIYNTPIIYDFDDAIWLEPEKKGSTLKRLFKSTGKIATICKWASTVVAGNHYLASYARQFNKNVVVIPTVVDTDNRFVPMPHKEGALPTIGWTGSHTTLPYLEALEPVLLHLSTKHRFSVMVMANKPPQFKQLPCDFIKWSEEDEVEELQKIDIGIMPLPDNEWTKGKCGFKAIQYMALGKPAVASAVGVNEDIIDHGINGFLCKSPEDWEKYLGLLLSDTLVLKQQGIAARQKIESYYSLKKAAAEWCKVLENV